VNLYPSTGYRLLREYMACLVLLDAEQEGVILNKVKLSTH